MVAYNFDIEDQDEDNVEEYSILLKSDRRAKRKQNMRKMKLDGTGNRESQKIILKKARLGEQ